MTSIRMFASSVVALTLASCANKAADNYDTSNPYGTADAGQTDGGSYQDTATSNPVYDTPAAYEESTGTTPAAEVSPPNLPAPSGTASRPSARPPAPRPTAGEGTVHVVSKGDSLWGISKKYNVPVASIKAANNLTSDVVVLGKKLVIPSR